MESFPLRRISTVQLARNPYWEYWLDTYSLRDGREQPYYFVHTRGSVMIIPITEDGSLVMVRQFRYLWQRESIEFPGGGIPEGATLSSRRIASCKKKLAMLQESSSASANTTR